MSTSKDTIGEQSIGTKRPSAARGTEHGDEAITVAANKTSKVVDAREEEYKDEGATDAQKVEHEALRTLGLDIGYRMEVMWLLEQDGESTKKWWGCSIASAVAGKRDEENRPIYKLHYDAFQGHEEADHEVAFVDGFRLIHVEDSSEMTWKKEGAEIDEEAVRAASEQEAVDLQQVIDAQNAEEDEAGEGSTEERGMKELQQLPFHQQAALAEGFRRLTDTVKDQIRAKIERQEKEGGGIVVISNADVEDMIRKVRAETPSVSIG